MAIAAASPAVAYTRALAVSLGAPPFVVGAVLVSIGTDLPEIANSVVAHLEGEADVNVGDSIGSALTQYTLVLGLFPLVIAVIAISRREAALVGLLTMLGLGLVIAFVSDGSLERWEGAVLVTAWAAFAWLLFKASPALQSVAAEEAPVVRWTSRRTQTLVVLVTVAIIAFGATIAVGALIDLAEETGVPELWIAFFGASLGTSAPELVVDITALMRGAPGIALGDAMGSSLVDATLSIGIGPIVKPGQVTADLAVRSTLYTLGAIFVVTVFLVARGRLDRTGTLLLLGLYGASYAVLLGTD